MVFKAPTEIALTLGRSIHVLDRSARQATARGAISDYLLLGRLVASLVLCTLFGCQTSEIELPPPASLPIRTTVIAQGQILPAGGIIRLAAPPGDVVASLLVDVGSQVNRGDLLLQLRSQEVTAAKLQTLRLQRQEAERERETAVASAQRQLASVELKIEHVQSQQESLGRKAELLEIAQEQVIASERMLKKLETISSNAVTSEFVGQLEIDRQRFSLRDAQLKYREQSETHRQANQDLEWGLKGAEAERAAAQALLAAAQASQALQILDAEIEALTNQAAASQIVAPIDGVILALNASVGESSLSFPLVELANLDKLVCEVEINELDAASVQPGQAATISARGLGERQLRGRVERKFNLVGRPQLRSPDPLARVDYRTVTATVMLDDESAAIAKDWLQLQVEVSIDITSSQVQ